MGGAPVEEFVLLFLGMGLGGLVTFVAVLRVLAGLEDSFIRRR